ncbi:ribonuclease J [Spiroplasma endosymbiont of Labia minor]|uniref:ribonuclease J n=1 Tax=Spiroplasma endosymbiont of Labia minor TaxID=3066305 RepID=UPI0030D38236
MSKINFIALGGQDERGKNLFLIEVDEDIFIFDAGVKFPDRGILGIDLVIPNIEYLKMNKNRIKGIFISSPSAYNSGALPYILKEIDVPVYCNELTTVALKYKNQRYRLKNRDANFKILKDKDVVNFGKNKIEVFRTTAVFPQTFGYVLHTENGLVIYAGDYIFDGEEKSFFSTDLQHIANISQKGVLAFLSDSEFASRSDFTSPNYRVAKHIDAVIKEKARLVIVIFEEDIFKFSEIASAAKANGRKIAVYGKTLATILESDIIHKNLNITKDDLFSIEEYVKSDNGVLLVTGTANLIYSRLAKIATGNDDAVEFTEDDIIVIATPPAAGIERKHAQVMDDLARTNARLIALLDRNIWSMKASYEDIKLMISLIKPKYFIPVKGLYKEFLKAKKAAIEAGLLPENVALIDNGQMLVLSKTDKLTVKVDAATSGDVYVDGIGIGDVGAVVLNERKQLSTDGIVIVGAAIDQRTKELKSLIDTQMRGVIYIQDDNMIFKQMQKQVTDILLKYEEDYRQKPQSFDLNALKHEIILKIRSTIKQDTGKTPIVLANITELDGSWYEPKKESKLNN